VFNPEQLRLASAAANQVAAAINNAELYRLIRDQADRLGDLVRSQQVESRKSRAMLEAIADGVMVTDEEQKIVLFNDAAGRLLGLSREQVLGRPAGEFIGLFGKAGLPWQERLRRWRADPAHIGGGDYLAERITLDSGRVLSVHLAPVASGEEFIGTVAVFRDITQEVEIDRLKSEFVATVSHELRTPMTSIKGYVEILLMGAAGSMTDQQKHFLEVVKANTERLAVLVNDLLDISQIEAGRVRLSMLPINLEEMVDQALADLERSVQGSEKIVTIEKIVQPSLPRVLGDRERMRRILDNLLENAYLYNKSGGKITVQMRQVEDEVQVDIKDTGIGIHPDDQPRVFERFFRGENPLALGVAGTGLGLSIVRNLVQMHNGRIWVESLGVPGEGSTFSFTLPVYHPD
jgi:PAS domain S-box-containing protein